MFDEFKETCLELAEHQKLCFFSKKRTLKPFSVYQLGTRNDSHRTEKLWLDNTFIICRKFTDLALLIIKSKRKRNIEVVACFSYKAPVIMYISAKCKGTE